VIRAGLIGYGLAGKVFHAPLLHAAGIRLAAVATSRRDEVAADWPDAAVEADPAALLARADMDLVVIATPNASHHPLALAALRAGRHVVIDKPFTVTSAEADELIGLARAGGLVLSAFQNRRWDSDFLTLRACLEAGEIGEVLLYQARFDRFRPAVPGRWRDRDEPGAGILYDLGSHLVDQALVLFGKPDWVQADLAIQREGARAVDAFHLTLAMGATRVELGASLLAASPGPKYVVHGRAGSFVKSGADVQEDQLKAGLRPGNPGFGEEPQETWPLVTRAGPDGLVSEARPAATGAYVDFYRGIARAVADGGGEPVAAEEARDVVRVIEAALASHREGRRVPFVPGPR